MNSKNDTAGGQVTNRSGGTKAGRMLYAFCLLVVLVFTLNACANDSGREQDTHTNEKVCLHVVTTVFPPYDFVRQIGGEHVEVSMLLAPGMESHSYEPTPKDMIRIVESDLFIYAGGESDVWVDELLEGETDSVRACAMIDWVDAVAEEHAEGMQIRKGHVHAGHIHEGEEAVCYENHEEDMHVHEEYDEHVWTSPKNAILIAEQICKELSKLDPAHADIYQSNAEAYIAELRQLDAEFSETVVSAARKELLFGDRFPFRYLTECYGLEYYAAFPGCSSETEPSAATLAFLIDKIREEDIPLILYLELSNHKVADIIAETTGVKTAMLHSCHNVTKEELEAGITYVQLMENNLEVLKEALN